MYFVALLSVSMNLRLCLPDGLTLSVCNVSLCLVIFFTMKYTLLDINIAPPPSD